jgi:hypothetical protein
MGSAGVYTVSILFNLPNATQVDRQPGRQVRTKQDPMMQAVLKKQYYPSRS